MKTHNWNNAPVKTADNGRRVLNAIKAGECIGSGLIAHRVNLSQNTVTLIMRRYIDSGEIRMTKIKGLPRYSRGVRFNAQARPASIAFAGPISIGRGLANW